MTSSPDARSLSSQADFQDAYQSHGEHYQDMRTALKPPLLASSQGVQEDDSYQRSQHYVKQRMSELRNAEFGRILVLAELGSWYEFAKSETWRTRDFRFPPDCTDLGQLLY